MVYSIIGNLDPGRTPNPPWKWAAHLANSWRTNIDIQIGFQAVPYIVDAQRRLGGNGSWCPADPKAPGGAGYPCNAAPAAGPCKTCKGPESFSGPGHWNDMDMLVVGTKTNTKPPFCTDANCTNGARPLKWDPLTAAQAIAQVSMWTILKSPMMASADFNNVSQELVEILSNDEVLAVSDDPLGKEAVRLGDEGRGDASTGELYVGQISNGGLAVVFFNRNWQPRNMTLVAADVATVVMQHGDGGLGEQAAAAWHVRDLWAHTENGTLAATGTMKVTVPGESAIMISLKPAAAAAAAFAAKETSTSITV